MIIKEQGEAGEGGRIRGGERQRRPPLYPFGERKFRVGSGIAVRHASGITSEGICRGAHGSPRRNRFLAHIRWFKHIRRLIVNRELGAVKQCFSKRNLDD